MKLSGKLFSSQRETKSMLTAIKLNPLLPPPRRNLEKKIDRFIDRSNVRTGGSGSKYNIALANMKFYKLLDFNL